MLHCFFADDLVLLAEDRKKMEMMLRNLVSYCQENELQVNTDKTKIMIAYKGSLSSLWQYQTGI